MEIRHRTPVSCEIKKRMFEGRTDDGKNGESLTSKYMPSYKYWMKIRYEDGAGFANCHRTKKEALAAYDTAKRRAGTLM